MDFPITVESQEAFDTLVKDRITREKTKQDELQQQVTDLTAEKADLEKTVGGHGAAIEAAKQEGRDEATTAMTDKVNSVLRAAEARATAAALRFRDPNDALAAIGDLSDVEIGDDYQVDSAALKERLSAIAEQKPYLIAAEDFTFEQEGGLGKKGSTDPLAGKTGVDLMATAFDSQSKQ